MANVNTVLVSGNITRDPELKQAGDSVVLTFGLAVNERVKKGETWQDIAHFFEVLIWGNRGKSLERILKKGMKISLEGKLRQNRWTTTDGANKSKVEIVARNVDFMNERPKSVDPTVPCIDDLEEDIPF